MLEVLLQPRRGNSAGGVFPCTGILGLSDVSLAGRLIVRPKHETGSLPTSQISVRVRCCQIRQMHLFSKRQEEVLWEREQVLFDAKKPGGRRSSEGEQEYYEDVSDKVLPWALEIPCDVADSCASSMRLPGFSIVWRVQAVLNHKPVALVGSRIVHSYLLNIKICKPSTESIRPLSPPSALVGGGMDVRVEAVWTGVPDVVGPGEEMPLALAVKTTGGMDNEEISVDKVTVTLERTLGLQTRSVERSRSSRSRPSEHTQPEAGPSSRPMWTPSPQGEERRSPSSFEDGSFGRRSSEPFTDSELADRLLPASTTIEDTETTDRSSSTSSTSSSSRYVELVQRLAAVECTGLNIASDDTTWATLRLTIPLADHGWDVGESMTTGQANLSFSLHTKILLHRRRPTPGVVGSKEKTTSSMWVDIPPLPIVVVAFSQEDRLRHMATRQNTSSWYSTPDIPTVSTSSKTRLSMKPSVSGLYSLNNAALDLAASIPVTSSSLFSISSLGLSTPSSLPPLVVTPPPTFQSSLRESKEYRQSGRDTLQQRPRTADSVLTLKEKSPSSKLSPGTWFGSSSPARATHVRLEPVDRKFLSFKRRPSATPSEDEMRLPARSRQRIEDLIS